MNTKVIPMSEYTLSDGTQWHAIESADPLAFRIQNVQDAARDMSMSQWNEYTILYQNAASAKLKAARAERHAARTDAMTDEERTHNREAIGDSIRELQYLLVPEYEAQAERLKALHLAEKARVQAEQIGDDEIVADRKAMTARLYADIANGHALINPLITGIELLQKALQLL